MSWFDKNRHRYPIEWKLIAVAVKRKAGWRCEACGAPHGPPPYVLTVDHLNHDPENRDAVLIALCQRCHLRRQGMYPAPVTKAEAIERLRARYIAEQSQQSFPGLSTYPADRD